MKQNALGAGNVHPCPYGIVPLLRDPGQGNLTLAAYLDCKTHTVWRGSVELNWSQLEYSTLMCFG